MKIRNSVLSICALALSLMYAGAYQPCYVTRSYVCHSAECWDGLYYYHQDCDTAGYVNRAAQVVHGSGLDDKRFVAAWCSWQRTVYDYDGTPTTTDEHDPIEASEAQGNPCSSE
jgi:hypothetical protein